MPTTSLADKALDAAMMGVPGLAFLLTSLRLPGMLGALTGAVVGVGVAAVMGVVVLYRDRIKAWPHGRVRRHLLLAAGFGMTLMVACFLTRAAVVGEYVWGDEAEGVFVPAVLAGTLQHPFTDCRLDVTPACERGAPAVAPTAQAVADIMSEDGPDAVRIPRGWAWRSWTAGLVAAFAIAAAALVYLAGLLRVRGLGSLTETAPEATDPPRRATQT